MKKLMFIVALAFIANIGFAQTATVAKSDLATLEWSTSTFDFGAIKQGVPITHEFKFTNTGKVAVIITDVHASCGCTTPSWSRDPIQPGSEGYVKATYNAANVGNFDKTVTVTANIASGTTTLRIKGEVLMPTTSISAKANHP